MLGEVKIWTGSNSSCSPVKRLVRVEGLLMCPARIGSVCPDGVTSPGINSCQSVLSISTAVAFFVPWKATSQSSKILRRWYSAASICRPNPHHPLGNPYLRLPRGLASGWRAAQLSAHKQISRLLSKVHSSGKLNDALNAEQARNVGQRAAKEASALGYCAESARFLFIPPLCQRLGFTSSQLLIRRSS